MDIFSCVAQNHVSKKKPWTLANLAGPVYTRNQPMGEEPSWMSSPWVLRYSQYGTPALLSVE